jgi:hypothetical protein
MSFSLQCNDAIDLYLLNKNIISKNRNIIALIISLVFAEYVKLTKNNIINGFIVPICIYILCIILLNICLPIIISNNERKMLKEKCMLWINDPDNKNINKNIILLNFNDIKNYVKTHETYENNDLSNNNSNNNDLSNINDLYNNNSNNSDTSNNNNNLNNNDISNNNLNEKFTASEDINLHNTEKSTFTKKILQKINLKPIPGPQWIPRSAEATQNRLNNGIYVPAYCNLSN